MDLIWIMIFAFAMVLLIIFAFIAVAFSWLQPVLPYAIAKLKKKDILIILGKDNRIRFIPAKYSSGVYTTSAPPYSFIQRVPKAYRLGTLNAVLVHDGWGIVVDPDMNEALKELHEQGYTTYEKLEEGLKSGKIHDADLIRIHAFKDIDISTIKNYIVETTPSEIRAHVEERVAKIVSEINETREDNGGGMPIITIIIILVVILFGAKMVGIF